jgi:transposase
MDEKICCGIDFHKRTSTLCFVDMRGQVKETVTIASDKIPIYLSNRGDLLVGIEASGGTNDMVQKLKDRGIEVRIINPNSFKAIGLGGKKTDEKDAKAIANALRLNFIPEVHHKSKFSRELKTLIVGREMLVRSRVNMVNHVRGTLREYGITMSQGMEKFTAEVKLAIKRVEHAAISHHLSYLVAQIEDLLKRQLEMEGELEKICSTDPRCKLLRTMPGIGLMTAVTFVAVLDELNRFKDGKSFASYIGLVPREHSSGDKRRMGSITRSGSELLRRYFIHGARSVLMYSEKKGNKTNDPNRDWALKIKARVGMNKATVALAHRMSRVAYAMLRDQKHYSTAKTPSKAA